MTVLACANSRMKIGGDELVVTARNVGGERAEIQTALIVRTVKLWQYLSKLIGEGTRTIPENVNSSVEMLVALEYGGEDATFDFEDWTETRVSCFDWNNRLGLTIHSNTLPQIALDVWYSMYDAKAELGLNTPNSTPQAAQTNAPAGQAMGVASNGAVTAVNGKSEAKQLPSGSFFTMPIAQISAAMSKTGVLTYELYGFYGGKAGKYPDLLAYSDNPVAINSGLIMHLTALNLKPGESRGGRWIARGQVSVKDGKTSLWLNEIHEG